MEYLQTLKQIFIDGHRYKYIWDGLLFSVGTTGLAAIIGIILGVLVAMMQLSNWHPFKNSKNKNLRKLNPLEKIAFGYVDLIRGTPAVVQLMIFGNLIFIGDRFREMPILLIAAISFGINSGAYVAEIIRAGIEGLDKGQMEAARALGLNYTQSDRKSVV